VLQFGAGCAGPLGPVRLRTPLPPTLGRLFSVLVPTPALSPAPVLSLHLVGLSNTTSSGVQLPYDLSAVGMPGCSLLIAADALHFTGSTGSSSYLTIPALPDYLRASFYLQGFAFDPQANALGLVATAAYRVVIGQ
jgi:hypothetical protein